MQMLAVVEIVVHVGVVDGFNVDVVDDKVVSDLFSEGQVSQRIQKTLKVWVNIVMCLVQG